MKKHSFLFVIVFSFSFVFIAGCQSGLSDADKAQLVQTNAAIQALANKPVLPPPAPVVLTNPAPLPQYTVEVLPGTVKKGDVTTTTVGGKYVGSGEYGTQAMKDGETAAKAARTSHDQAVQLLLAPPKPAPATRPIVLPDPVPAKPAGLDAAVTARLKPLKGNKAMLIDPDSGDVFTFRHVDKTWHKN